MDELLMPTGDDKQLTYTGPTWAWEMIWETVSAAINDEERSAADRDAIENAHEDIAIKDD
jgi:hypothetical protein